MSECPMDCPNRKSSDTSRVTTGAYVFALLLTIFLAFQCVSYERRNEETPVQVWMPCLLFIGAALGINIDAGAIATALGGKR